MYSGALKISPQNCAAQIIDLRSDTVTRPDDAMRDAMLSAEVGDDVYGDDPCVNALEDYAADLLGKEAALFCPSGTQSNLIGVLAQCARGDEVILGNGYHLYRDEAAGVSVLGGVSLCPIPMRQDGSLDPSEIRAAVKADDPHYARSRLLSLENTVAGRAIDGPTLQAASVAARDAGLRVHLDGARIFNACTSAQTPVGDFAAMADTVSMCLSKGLGAPVGSLLLGDRATMERALRLRKQLGGGMRQAGFLAAAGLHALRHGPSQLAADHRRASQLAGAVENLPYLLSARAATNMVFLKADDETATRLQHVLAEHNIFVGGQRPEMRLVLHKDIGDAELDRVIAALEAFR